MNELYELLDMKGLAMHSYHRCNDKDSTLFKTDGKRTARAEAAFETLLDSYLLDILRETAPKDVIAVWEGGNDRRIALFEGYKKKRRTAEKDPVVEIELGKLYRYIKGFLAGLGCTQIKYPYAEGDDVLAYLSSRLPTCSVRTIDSDLIQLSSDHCMVTQRDEVKEEDDTGTPPHLIALMKSVVGDTSDEYPGVKGLGKVAWQHLMDDFGVDGMEELDYIAQTKDISTLEEIAADDGSKELNAIAKAKYQWLLQYELARLHPEWCEQTYDKTIIRPEIFKRLPDRRRVEEVMTACGCLDLMPELEKYLPHTVLVTADNVDALLYDGDFLDDFNESVIAFDYESYDVNKFENFVEVKAGKSGEYVDVLSQDITGASFTWGPNSNKTIYVCFNHKDTNNCSIDVLYDLLDAADHLVCHNDGFEYPVTAMAAGKGEALKLLGKMEDTKILASYVDENAPSHSLKPLSKKYLNYHQTSYKEVIGDKEDMSQLTGEEVLGYGADDAIVTAHLYSLFKFMAQVEGSYDFILKYEPNTNRVISDAFMEGCRVSLDRLEALRKEDQARLDELWPRLRHLLETHCTEERHDRADTYMSDIKAFEVAKMSEAGKTEEEIADKLAEIRTRFATESKYVPLEEKVITYDFLPTVSQLNKAIDRLGMTKYDEEQNPLNHLKSVAVSRVSEWAWELREEVAPDLTDKQREFVHLVSEAAHLFKVREGEELEKLAAFVEDLFPEKRKVEHTGTELNFGSPIQSAILLYGMLGVPIRVRTKVDPGSTRDRLGFKGGPAANDKAIETALAEDLVDTDSWEREAIEAVREIKSLETMFGLYYNPYPLWVRPDDGKVHPGIVNCGTATRRPTGTSPNLLQVKKGKIRSIFLPMREGHVLVAPDFSGQELRILGSESGDPVIYDAYMGESKKDIHSLTASAIAPKITKKLKPHLSDSMKLAPGGKSMDYAQFEEWRHSKDKEKADYANFIRNKRAKACIAEGALVLTDRGLVPIEGVLLSDKVWDGLDWVSHEGVIYKGIQEVVTYEGLTATTDHEVFTDDGRKLALQEILDTYEQERPSLAVGEAGGHAVRYTADSEPCLLGGASELPLRSKECVHSVSAGKDYSGGQSIEGADNRVSVPAEEVQGPPSEDTGGEVQGNSSEVQEPQLRDVQELRREGSREQVREPGEVHNLGAGEPASRDVQGGAAGQEGQRGALRAGEPEAGDPVGELVQQEDDCFCGVQGPEGGAAAPLAPDKGGLPKLYSVGGDRGDPTEEGDAPGGHTVPQEESRGTALVYDIVNAGPRHRFTVSGKIVQNCNFLVNYEGGAGTLSTNILVKREEAQEFIDGMLDLYKGITPFQEKAHKDAAGNGYVQTAYGNRRHATDNILSRDEGLSMRMERQVSNFIIQGTAADILKVVMSEALTTGLLEDTESFIMAPVYDEVVCSVPVGHVVEFCQRLQKIMDLTPPNHTIPMMSEFSIGYDWFNMVEIGTDTSESGVLEGLSKAGEIQKEVYGE